MAFHHQLFLNNEDENFLKIKEFMEQSKGKTKSGINRKNNSIKRDGKSTSLSYASEFRREIPVRLNPAIRLAAVINVK
jgi:hypothetical protein